MARICGIVRWPFRAGIPGAVVTFPVAIVFAVGLVVLLVERHEVTESEAIVGGDEVDARVRLAARFPDTDRSCR